MKLRGDGAVGGQYQRRVGIGGEDADQQQSEDVGKPGGPDFVVFSP